MGPGVRQKNLKLVSDASRPGLLYGVGPVDVLHKRKMK